MGRFLKRFALLVVGAALAALIFRLANHAYREARVEMALSEGRAFQPPESTPRPHVLRDPPKALRPPVPSRAMPDPKFDNPAAAALDALDKNDCDRVITVYTEMLKTKLTPDFVWLFRSRRGNCYLEKDQPEKALADYDELTRLGWVTPAIRINRASALLRLGRREEAFREFDAGIASDPQDPAIYAARAEMLEQQGELQRAIEDYQTALTIDPRNVRLRLACVALYLRSGESHRAIAETTKVMQLDRASYRAYIARAEAFAQLGMFARATEDLDTIDRLNPPDPVPALNSVAWHRATDSQTELRNGEKAVAEASKACELDHWTHWAYIDTLAASCAEAARFDEASKYEQQAIQMAAGDKKNTQPLEQRLELYQQHRAYHEEEKQSGS